MQKLLFLLEIFLLFLIFYKIQFNYFDNQLGNNISISLVFTLLAWVILEVNINNVWSKDNFLFEVTPEKRCDGGPYMYSSNPELQKLCGEFSQNDLNRFECSNGYMHTSAYSDVIIRNPIDFSEVPDGNEGLIQLLSIIPMSYPGHSILSEDVGVIVNRDFCSCGRRGKHFLVHGRIKDAELRGCSDATIL